MTVDRRGFLRWTGAATVLAAGCKASDGVPGVPPADPEATPPRAPVDAKLVRVSSVPTAVEGNLLPTLIAAFEQQSHYKVELTTNPSLYDFARNGRVDLAISHYGHKHAEDFVSDGLGEWPRTLFSNQLALVGPKDDPANVRGLDDAGEAFRRITSGNHRYLVNELDGLRYVTEIMWHLAGKPDRAPWLRAHEKEEALREAAKAGAYTLWGLTPFLRTRKREGMAMDPLVLADPLFQRLLVSIVVKPRVGAINVEGARAFQQFMLEPETQARMRSVEYSEDERIAVWVPAGRHNRNAVLPGTKG